MQTKFFGLVFLGACSIAPQLSAGPVLWAVTQTGTLSIIDQTTASVTPVGTIAGTLSIIGLATSNGHMYALDANSNNLLEISTDPNQHGAILNTFSIGLGTPPTIGEGDITFDGGSGNFNGSGTMYIESAQFNLEKFFSATLTNSTTGTSTLLKSCNTATCVNGDPRLLFDGTSFVGGTLYGLQQGGAGLYTIDTGTGLPTLAGATGIGAGNANGGLTTRPGDNQLFGDLANNSAATLYMFGINGTPTAVGTMGSLTNVTGLAFTGTGSATPEPGTIALVTAGLGLMVWRLRSRRTRGNQ